MSEGGLPKWVVPVGVVFLLGVAGAGVVVVRSAQAVRRSEVTLRDLEGEVGRWGELSEAERAAVRARLAEVAASVEDLPRLATQARRLEQSLRALDRQEEGDADGS